MTSNGNRQKRATGHESIYVDCAHHCTWQYEKGIYPVASCYSNNLQARAEQQANDKALTLSERSMSAHTQPMYE